jgi:tol-pal system protein YbgF
MRLCRAFVSFPVACALAGCGSASQQNLDQLERQVATMHRQLDVDRQSMHDLENRIFVLEDKLDTAKVEREKRPDVVPRLPVVTKHKPTSENSPAPASLSTEEEDAPDTGTTVITLDDRGSMVSESKESTPTASKSAPPTAARRAPPISPPSGDNLGVVPLPDGQKTLSAAAPKPLQPDALSVYKSAYEALKRREHATAIAGFKTFLSRFPDHDYSDNAQYWLGEAYYDQADWKTALAEFRKVIKRYPGGNKAPDALLKIGFCYVKLGDAAAAGDVLQQVLQIYPKTDAARLAQKRLDEMRQ